LFRSYACEKTRVFNICELLVFLACRLRIVASLRHLERGFAPHLCKAQDVVVENTFAVDLNAERGRFPVVRCGRGADDLRVQSRVMQRAEQRSFFAFGGLENGARFFGKERRGVVMCTEGELHRCTRGHAHFEGADDQTAVGHVVISYKGAIAYSGLLDSNKFFKFFSVFYVWRLVSQRLITVGENGPAKTIRTLG